MSNLKRFEFLSTFGAETKFLSIWHLNPYQSFRLRSWNTLRVMMIFIIMVCTFGFISVTMFANDIEDLLGIATEEIPGISMIIKAMIFYKQRNVILNIFNGIPISILATCSNEQLDRVKMKIHSTEKNATFYKTAVVVYICILPVMTRFEVLPVKSWTPCNLENIYCYIIFFLIQVLACFLCATTNTCIDVIFTKLVVLCSCQFELVVSAILDIDFQENSVVVEQKLKKIIEFHIKAVRLVQSTNRLFSYIALTQSLASMYIISITVFQMIIIPSTSSYFIPKIIYFVIMVFEIIIYCFYGNSIITKNDSVRQACYMSNWYEADIKIRKMIITIMQNTQKPVLLTAGGFFDLSLTSLSKILNTSYSYLTVLQSRYK